ncbi:hypothetical protein GCM10010251_80330 [Streptomyces aurantiogriseus]|uniref:N-acetyltransferase domain-containing protein n=2 Tax=Streptomyces aurantiogriseus TaxID=66870 RepID=A0A918KYT9_9ACTN|nr:hypothetical protein GCM10010251_80330 [Streptomyces aurantiogriseus]
MELRGRRAGGRPASLRSGHMKDDQAARVHERLAARPELRPVVFGEGRRFGLWELASLAEGALGECVDPDSLTVSSEKRWRLRLGAAGHEHRHDDEFRRRYWICAPEDRCRQREPLGTIALDTWPVGAGALHVSSLYTHPVARRQGLASAVLDTVYEACRAEGLHGFRLDTYWTWQQTVRYYLRRGLWVTSWKHSLGLARLSYLPRYEVRGDESALTFAVTGPQGDAVPLLVADSADGRLRLRETEQYRSLPDRRDAVRLYARSTLALHLALRGRPLVRGEEEWAEARRWCDIGEPEGLAYKIGVFEEVAHENGWKVETPYVRPSG